MEENKRGGLIPKPKRKDKEYDRAISLMQYYVQLMWFVYGAFLLAETFLLGAIIQLAETRKALAVGGSLFGFLLTVPWWTSFKYYHVLYLFIVAKARACEPATGTFFLSGGHLIKGKKYRKDKRIGEIAMPFFARVFGPSRAVTSLIYAFAICFFFVGCYFVSF